MKSWTAWFALGLGPLSACAVVEYGVGSGGSGAINATGGFGGASDGGAGAATSTTTDMGGSTTTEMGGAPPVLANSGLVARYYLDEAASGSPNGGTAIDAAPDPLNLPITWAALGELHYEEIGNQRGLSCAAAGLDARASVANMSNTKLQGALNGSPTGTLEVVLAVSAVHMSNSRFIHIGTADESGRFSLSAGSMDELNFFWRPNAAIPTDDLAGHWPITFTPGERIVLHAVLDSTEPVEEDRARLYRNGAPVSGNDTKTPVALGQVINLDAGHAFVLGNREIGVRTFAGTLFYAAVYSAALSSSEVANNALVLLASDDEPE